MESIPSKAMVTDYFPFQKYQITINMQKTLFLLLSPLLFLNLSAQNSDTQLGCEYEYHGGHTEEVSLDSIIDLRRNFQPYIRMIKPGEELSLHYTSQGCFHQFDDVIIIQLLDDGLYITHQDQSEKMTAQEVEAFEDFEFMLFTLFSGICTTVETYKVSLGDQCKQVVDGSCSVHLYRQLVEEIALLQKHYE